MTGSNRRRERVLRLARVLLACLLGVAGAVIVGPQAAHATTAPPWYFWPARFDMQVGANATVSPAIACPSGLLPISGGISSDFADFRRLFEYVDFSSGTYDFGVHNPTSSGEELTFTVQCASISADSIHTAFAQFPRDSHTNQGGGWVSCPAGSQAVGGGEYWTESGTRQINYAAPTDDGHGWYATGASSVSLNTLHVEAYCIAADDLTGELHVASEMVDPTSGELVVLGCPDGTRFLTGGMYAAIDGQPVDAYTYAGRMVYLDAAFVSPDWEMTATTPSDPPATNIDAWLTAWCVPASTPQATITSGPPSVTNRTSATFVLAASDPVGYSLTASCHLDFGTSVPCDSSPVSVSGLAEGAHTFDFTITNPDGQSDTATDTWTVDTTPPTATITGGPATITNAASASFTFQFADAHPPADWQPACSLDGAPAVPCDSATGTSYAGPLADGAHSLTVTAADRAGNLGAASYRWTVDTHAPTVSSTSPSAAFTLSGSTTVAWSGADDSGGSGIAQYQVRERSAPWNGGFSAWVTPPAWAALSPSTTQVGARLHAGSDSCFAVRAVDRAGNASAWSPARCTAVPLDDRSLILATSGWRRGSGTAYYNRTYTTTARRGAELSRGGTVADRIALLATHCAGCGKASIYAGRTLLGTVNLERAATTYEVLSYLPTFPLREATITIKVTTRRKQIPIDGLGISRT